MCQTVCISESIVSLSKRSFTRRLKIASSRMVAEKGMLARLNNQLDELYELLYDNFTSMSVSDYKQFAPQLAVLIETLKSLHRDYLHSSYKHALSDSINRLQGNISAIEEIRQDILHFKVNLLRNPRYSGIIAQAKALWFMVAFFSIQIFRDRLLRLLDMKRGVYAGVDDEIVEAFSKASIEEIRNNRDMILIDDPVVVVKLRLPDHKNKRSRKDGYRLIYLTYRNQEKVVFLDIYPKNGPYQQLDTSDERLLDLIQSYNEEAVSSLLVMHNLADGLKL